MKKFFCIVIVFVFIIFGIKIYNGSLSMPVFSYGLNVYAQVTSNSCYLYKSPTNMEDFDNKYFLLEESYYVKLLEQANEDFFKVQYLDIMGYVKIDDVTPVNETPTCPYLECISFDISPTLESFTLRSIPNSQDDSNIIVTAKNQTNLDYFGKIAGNESVPSLGNLWYYCQVNVDGKDYRGYIYSPYAINLSPIVPNNEIVTSTSIEKINATQSLLKLNLTTENIIIILVTIPSIVVLYLLLKPPKVVKS